MKVELPFTWIRCPMSTIERLLRQRRELTLQRAAWVKVALEQAQTIATLRKLLIARGPRKVGRPPELGALYEGPTRSWPPEHDVYWDIYGPNTIKPVTGDMS